jgi:hypothetical protein
MCNCALFTNRDCAVVKSKRIRRKDRGVRIMVMMSTFGRGVFMKLSNN